MKNVSVKKKQDKINSIIRGIAYTVFSAKGGFKFSSAYDKLHSRVYLDHNIKISNRIKGSNIKNAGIFDVVTEDELTLVLQSSIGLAKMYEDVVIRKVS